MESEPLVIHWFDTELKSNIICEYLYEHPFTHKFIPRMYDEGQSIIYVGGLNVLILIGLLIFLNCTQTQLLRFYNYLLWIYTFVASIGAIFAFLKYFLPDDEGGSALHDDEPVLPITILRSILLGLLISIQVLVLLTIIQTKNISPTVRKRSLISSFFVFSIICGLELLQHFLGYNKKNLFVYCLLNLIMDLFPTIIYIFALIWVFCLKRYRYINKRQERKKIIWKYCISMLVMLSGSLVSYTLMVSGIDGYCFDAWTQYSFRLVYPFLFWYTTYKDNAIWEKLVDSLFRGNNKEREEHLSQVYGSKTWTKINNNENILNEPLLYSKTNKFLSASCKTYDMRKLEEPTEELPMGTTAEVSVRKVKGKNEYVVVKEMNFKGNKGNPIRQSLNTWSPEQIITNLTNYVKEAVIIRNIKHKNIVEFKGYSVKLNRFGEHDFYLIYEYCNQGDLVKFLNLYNNKRNIDHKKIDIHRDFKIRIGILLDVCGGMQELHKNNIIHRDLKPANVLIHSFHSDDEKHHEYTAKICDFGCCKKVPPLTQRKKKFKSFGIASDLSEEIMIQQDNDNDDNDDNDDKDDNDDDNDDNTDYESSIVGTPAYSAPELHESGTIYRVDNDQKLYALDVYAFGIVMWEIGFCQNVPALEQKTQKPEIYPFQNVDGLFDHNQDAYILYTDLMQWCWDNQPEERPSFKTITIKLQQIQDKL